MSDPSTPAEKVDRLWANPVVGRLARGGLLSAPSRGADPGLPAADERYEYQFLAIRNVPGTSAGVIYVCLPSAANPPTWSWKVVATG